MSKGYVYILTNEAMPSMVKIGMTTGDPEARAAQLYQTGVPLPFHVYDERLCPDCAQIERQMHERFAMDRVSDSREFFRCDPDDACFALYALVRNQVSDWVSDFLPDHTICEDFLSLDETSISEKAKELQEESFIVPRVLMDATPEELAPAVSRVHAAIEAKKKERPPAWMGPVLEAAE